MPVYPINKRIQDFLEIKLNQLEARLEMHIQELYDEIKQLKAESLNKEKIFIKAQEEIKRLQILVENNGGKKVNSLPRSCSELKSADPTLPSGNYAIDPDGTDIGDQPIYVYCNMVNGMQI